VSPTQTLVFGATGGSLNVTNIWQIGGSYTGWEQLHILTPNDIISARANFTLICGGSVSVVNATVDIPSFTGACPKTFTFSGTIATSGPATVTYRWERSDNAQSPIQTLTFAAAGSQTVTETWQLGATYSGWERLHVLTPSDLLSNQATFNLTCSSRVTGATSSVDTPIFVGACPKTFTFSGSITTNGPATVTYRWERSDNAQGPIQTLTFLAAGSQTVTETWQLGATYSGWERIHILTPNDLISNQAVFNLSCSASSVTNILISVNPSSFSGPCPKIIAFSATITVDGPAVVTYRWQRSDNAQSPIQTLTFTAAGSQTVSETWQLGGNYSGWERIHILTPNDFASPQAPFSLVCYAY
jgi:hypothetical protein